MRTLHRDLARITRALDRFEYHESRLERYGRTTRHRGDAAMVGTRERYARTMAYATSMVRYAAREGITDADEAVTRFERAVQSGKSPGSLTVSREAGVERRPGKDRMASFRKWQADLGRWAEGKGLTADQVAEAIEYRRGGSDGKPRGPRKPRGRRRPRRQHGTKITGGRRS